VKEIGVMNESQESNLARDADTKRVLGVFFALMGFLVLVGTFGSIGHPPAVVVSICSGFVLLAIGLGMFRSGSKYRADSSADSSSE